jgi:hypothetical protein
MRVAGAAVLVAAGVTTGASSAQADTRYACETGYVCFYSKANGYGDKCSWEGNDDKVGCVGKGVKTSTGSHLLRSHLWVGGDNC